MKLSVLDQSLSRSPDGAPQALQFEVVTIAEKAGPLRGQRARVRFAATGERTAHITFRKPRERDQPGRGLGRQPRTEWTRVRIPACPC